MDAHASGAAPRVAEEDGAKQYLELMLLATDFPNPRIVQLCVRDHSNGEHGAVPHLHVQCHLRNSGGGPVMTAEWTTLNRVSVWDLKSSCRALPHGATIRFHMHEDKPATQPTAAPLLERLRTSCSYTLTTEEATALRGKACPICLEAFGAGDAAVFMPCRGSHLMHTSCAAPWLEKASSCPTCRFELPTKAAAGEQIDALVGQSQAAMERLRADMYRAAMYPMAGAGTDGTCDDCDDDDDTAAAAGGGSGAQKGEQASGGGGGGGSSSSGASSSGRGAADPKTKRGVFRFGRRFKERSLATAPRLM